MSLFFKLGQVATIVTGQSPDGHSYNTAKTGLPFFQGKTEFGLVYPTPVKWCSAPKKTAEAGDILLSVRAPVGPTNIASELCCIGRGLAAIRPKPDIVDKDYLLLFLKYAEPKLVEKGQGSTFQAINSADVANLKVWTPKIDKQQLVARHLNFQLAAVEEARQAAQSQLNDSKRLIPALLSATFDHLDDAEWRPIGDVAKTTSGTTPSRGQKDLWQPPLHPWVKTGEVAFKTIHQTEESVSAKALAECSLTLLPAGTVLVAMYGQGKTRGQSALLNVAATTNQACFAILPTPALDPEYLQFWLRHSYEALRSLSDSRGGNQSNLNGALMNAFEVPLLPLEKQQAIARHIKQAIEDANALQQTIEQQLRDIERLPSRLLAAAFDAPATAPSDNE